MPFEKGKPRAPTAGRRKGVPNKITTTMKEMVSATLENLDGITGMTKWARENPTEFYKIASKLLPMETTGQMKTIIEYVDPTKE